MPDFTASVGSSRRNGGVDMAIFAPANMTQTIDCSGVNMERLLLHVENGNAAASACQVQIPIGDQFVQGYPYGTSSFSISGCTASFGSAYSYIVGGGTQSILGPFEAQKFVNSAGKMTTVFNVTATNGSISNLKVAVIKIP